MKTLGTKTLWLLLGVAAAGCSFTPQSGQFACGPEGSCPAGLVCAGDICFSNMGPWPDAGEDDADTPDGNTPDTFDAGPLPDAGPDAGPQDAGRPLCAADFCADFDESDDVEEGWTVFEVASSGTFARVLDDDAPSPPAVFRTSVQTADQGMFRAARLSFQQSDIEFETVTPQLSLALQFRVDSISNDAGAAAICGIRYGAPERYVSIVVSPGDDSEVLMGAETYADGVSTPLVDIGPVAVGEWHTLRITIPERRSASGSEVGGGVSFALDDFRATGSLPPASLGPALRVDVGLGTTNVGSVVVDIDSVELDYLAE